MALKTCMATESVLPSCLHQPCDKQAFALLNGVTPYDLRKETHQVRGTPFALGRRVG